MAQNIKKPIKKQKLVLINGKPIDAINFNQYKEVHGDERAEGYLEAFVEMTKLIGESIGFYNGENTPNAYSSGTYNSAMVTRNYIINLWEHNRDFLSNMDNFKDKDQLEKKMCNPCVMQFS